MICCIVMLLYCWFEVLLFCVWLVRCAAVLLFCRCVVCFNVLLFCFVVLMCR